MCGVPGPDYCINPECILECFEKEINTNFSAARLFWSRALREAPLVVVVRLPNLKALDLEILYHRMRFACRDSLTDARKMVGKSFFYLVKLKYISRQPTTCLLNLCFVERSAKGSLRKSGQIVTYGRYSEALFIIVQYALPYGMYWKSGSLKEII